MASQVRCKCGASLKAPEKFAGSRALCPMCGGVVEFSSPKDEELAPVTVVDDLTPPARPVVDFLDPPRSPFQAPRPKEPAVPWTARLLAALLDPRSIQWMLMLGGVLMVIGLIVWLISEGLFENRLVVAASLGLGSLLVHLTGCWVYLKTRHRAAGQALTFLGCVLLPLNLWHWHAQGLVTLEGGLWIGAAVCSLIYIATVYRLKDPLFMYAVTGGVVLTVLLLLADLGRIADVPSLCWALMGLGLISLHLERAFPPEGVTFTRRRFGLPLFWSAQALVGVSVGILLAAQTWNVVFSANAAEAGLGALSALGTLAGSPLLAGALWIAAAYAWLYSDIVVRRVGVYTYLAAFAAVMAEMTLIGPRLGMEGQIAVLSLTALAASVALRKAGPGQERLHRLTEPLAILLSSLPVAMAYSLHWRATSDWASTSAAQDAGWTYSTGWLFVAVTLLTAVVNRVSAFICRRSSPRLSTVYFFFSAAALILAAAGLLRVWGLVDWSKQAPLLMLIPIGYLIASRLWRGRSPEWPLYWVAQASTAVIGLHAIGGAMSEPSLTMRPIAGEAINLLFGLVFVEATVFYVLAALFHRRSANVHFAAAAACGALWQLMGYFDAPAVYYTPLFAALGWGLLLVARRQGLASEQVYRPSGEPALTLRGPGLPAWQVGNGILLVTFLAALLQGLARLASPEGDVTGDQLASLAATNVLLLLAMFTVGKGAWRQAYGAASGALFALLALTFIADFDLSGWQKLEIFLVILGLVLLTVSLVGRFTEQEDKPGDSVLIGLAFGSLFVAVPLLIAVMCHRSIRGNLSAVDEIALVSLSVLMLLLGVAARAKAPTIVGGASLAVYLAMVILSLAYFPQATVGVYLAVGGGSVFLVGLALLFFRERLAELPKRISEREGVFQVLNWK